MLHLLIALALNLKDTYAGHSDDRLCVNTEFDGKIMQVQRKNKNGIRCTVKLGTNGKVTRQGDLSDASLCRTLRRALRKRWARGCMCHGKRYATLSKVGRYPTRFCINGKIIEVEGIFFIEAYGLEAWFGK